MPSKTGLEMSLETSNLKSVILENKISKPLPIKGIGCEFRFLEPVPEVYILILHILQIWRMLRARARARVGTGENKLF